MRSRHGESSDGTLVRSLWHQATFQMIMMNCTSSPHDSPGALSDAPMPCQVVGPTRTCTRTDLETPREGCGLLGPDRPHFRPHISATPRDETDTRQHVSLKTNDMRDETDTQQQLASFF